MDPLAAPVPWAAGTPLQAEFGAQRWGELAGSLQEPKRYAVWANPFAERDEVSGVLREHGLAPLAGEAGRAHIWAPQAAQLAQASGRPLLPKPPTCPSTGPKLYYHPMI